LTFRGCEKSGEMSIDAKALLSKVRFSGSAMPRFARSGRLRPPLLG